MSPARPSLVVSGVLALASFFAVAPVAQAAQLSSVEVQGAVQQMERAAGGPVSATVSPDTGAVTFLIPSRAIPVAPIAGASSTNPEELALSFLRTYGRAFGLREAGSELTLKSPAERDELGFDRVRFQQVVRGVPVTAGEVMVHLNGSSVRAVNAETLPGLQAFDVTPAVSTAIARDKVLELAARRLGKLDVELSEPRLEILNRGLLEGRRHPTRLAWFVEATGPGLREFVWIDAKKGFVLLHFSQLTTALNRQIYNGGSTAALPGTLIRSEGGPPTGDLDADAAYQYSGDTYNYYLTQHGRDSFDGTGGAILSTVHHCPSAGDCPYDNAYWSGTQLVYGDGLSRADDVDAHELTHAVIERTANLFYYMQSGALNESFSDMFGETVDLTNTGGTDTAGVRWKVGEDIPGGALRDMMNPGLFGDPGRVTDPSYYCNFLDNGGVHFNSGVPNHFYALLTDGGTYNSVTVTGIGLTKAGKIAYRALTHYLLSGSGFLDAATALGLSCTDLVGTAGIVAGDCTQVTAAVNAVELTQPLICAGAGPLPPALCPVGQAPTNVFFDDVESGLSNTNWNVTSVGTDNWFVDTTFATSGDWHFYGYDSFEITDTRLEMDADVAIPANARMQLNHAWDFDWPNYDGGVLEVSTNSGGAWTDAASLFSAGATYGGAIDTGFGNPIGGRNAFVSSSYGYTATQLNLSSLAGQNNVRFRFRLGTDDSLDWYGWFVDDIRIYTCAAGGCTYTLSATSGFVGAGGGSGDITVTAGPGCAWTSSSAVPWIVITSSGTGNGTATYTVAPNPTASPRNATITIAGQTVTIYQGGEADYHTLTPCRVYDTRLTGGTPLTSQVPRTFTVAGLCNIPTTATAVSVNVTVANATAQGNFTYYPGGLPRPVTSTLNFVATQVRANNAILVLAPDGSGTIQGYAFVADGGTVDTFLDVTGYFQ